MQFSSRLYRDYTDLEQMRRFLIRARARQGHLGGYFHVGDLLWRMFSNGWFRPKQDIRLWFDSTETLVGFAWYDGRSHALDIQAFPRHTALEQEMLAWGESCLLAGTNGNGRKQLITPALDSDSERIALLTEMGYERQKQFYYHYLRPLPPNSLTPQLPPGFTLRHLNDEDVPAKVALHRAAFHPSPMTEEIYTGVRQAPGYIPELDLVVVAPDGRFAAFCICWMDPVNRIGEFEPVGTHPDFQKQGLAQSVMTAGLQRMQAFGADQALVLTPGSNQAAQALYQSLTFKAAARDFDYMKQF
ncbi:MAG: GNAT family N-acetyltransferase [Ardenticatenaceae bacterium]|nr:GNAT family N-acetyltransferase [Ardenticatenaceae bacterium]